MGFIVVNDDGDRRIEDALRRLAPEPSARLYGLLSDAPWLEEAPVTDTARPLHRSLGPWTSTRSLAILAVGLIAAIIASLLAFGGRALAQEIEEFFQRAAAQVIRFRPDDSKSRTPIAGLTVEEAEGLTGFDLLLPAEVPHPFALTDISYDPSSQSVMLSFSRNGRILWIVQQQSPFTHNGHPTDLIGPDAEVETVSIAGQPAEMVSGSWRIQNGAYSSEVEAEWMSDVPAKLLRWRINDLYVEVFAAGGSPGHPGYMNSADLIKLAESLR